VKADGDPTLFVGRYLRRTVGAAYGLEVITEENGRVGYRWTTCRILEAQRRDGTQGLDICGGHEAWWKAIADSVEDGPEVRVTQNMRDGAPHCEIWLRRKAADTVDG
jgi:hypothetical protein